MPSSIVPPKYLNSNYDDIPKLLREKYEKLPETRKGLYIHGGVGVGKTHAMYAMFKSDKPKGNYRKTVWNVTELLHEFRLDFDRENIDKTRSEERLMQFNGILFLDDLGAERITDWVQEKLYMIINKRYEQMLPTIYTSNCTLEELAERVGDRIVSRIVESTNVFEMKGQDRRLMHNS